MMVFIFGFVFILEFVVIIVFVVEDIVIEDWVIFIVGVCVFDIFLGIGNEFEEFIFILYLKCFGVFVFDFVG